MRPLPLGLVVLLASACGKTAIPVRPDQAIDDVPPGPAADAGPAALPLTWYQDVLPIVQNRCQGCHAEGGIAPFALLTYAEAQRRHAGMAFAAQTRQMPPWM